MANLDLNFLDNESDLKECIKAVIPLEEKSLEKDVIPSFFEQSLIDALKNYGFDSLYSHQALSFQYLKEGKNVLISTPTASGKSLIYFIYALDSYLKDKSRKFFFVYPYKALAQDQFMKFNQLMFSLNFPEFRAEIYDGDTSSYKRKKIQKEKPPVIMTNPEMLHLSFLAYLDNWRDFLSNLFFIAIDEAHIYRGIFGAHIYNLFFRLKRVVSKKLQWIGTSATIGEGKNFFSLLTGEESVEVSHSGAPKPKRTIYVLEAKGSPYTLASNLIEKLILSKKRTVAFTKARRITELIYTFLMHKNPSFKEVVSSYRAGFLPNERREIEKKFFEGSLLCVVSTSAMEAGIDVGGLDACILIGFPGSLVSLYQRMGRVGRKDHPADVFLITLPDALDHYYLKNPEELVRKKVEEPILDPFNEYVIKEHILCAAKEKPINDSEIAPESPFRKAINSLDKEGLLVLDASGKNWHTIMKNPHKRVNFRSLGEGYEIVNENGKTIGTIDGVRVYRECYEGAIYLHQGVSYEVMRISEKDRKVFVKISFEDYYTEVRSEKDSEILEILLEKQFSTFKLGFCRVKITEKIYAYVKKRLFSSEIIGEYPLDMPPIIFETESLFLMIDEKIRDILLSKGFHSMGSLHGCEHALIGVFPLITLADRWDIGGISFDIYPLFRSPAIFIYDGYEGGIGIAKKGYENLVALLEKTLSVVSSCECEDGCPSCIQSPKCGNGNKPLDKNGTVELLNYLLLKKQVVKDMKIEPINNTIVKRKREVLGKVVFDIETKNLASDVGGWGNIGKLGISLAVLWEIGENRWFTFYEENIEELIEKLFSAELVIGFNSKRFDYWVLKSYCECDFSKLNSLDLLEKIEKRLKFKLSLDSLAMANFNEKKIGNGLLAVKWFKEGKIELVEKYCKKDVELTGRLYKKGLEEGYILFKDKNGNLLRLNIDGWR